MGKVVGYFKVQTTKEINELRQMPGARFWQCNYYERIIRNEREFEAVFDYIDTNPLNWDEDEYRAG